MALVVALSKRSLKVSQTDNACNYFRDHRCPSAIAVSALEDSLVRGGSDAFDIIILENLFLVKGERITN